MDEVLLKRTWSHVMILLVLENYLKTKLTSRDLFEIKNLSNLVIALLRTSVARK